MTELTGLGDRWGRGGVAGGPAAGSEESAAWMSASAAARMLPISPGTLRKYARADAFFGPDLTALAGVPGGLQGPRLVRYHREHVRLIDRVLTGDLDRETAGLMWERWKAGRRL